MLRDQSCLPWMCLKFFRVKSISHLHTLSIECPLKLFNSKHHSRNFFKTILMHTLCSPYHPNFLDVWPLFTYMIIITVSSIRRPPNVYSLATLLHKQGISAIHLSLGNFMLTWMSPSLKNNPFTPKIPFWGRKIYKNGIFGFKKNYLIGLNQVFLSINLYLNHLSHSSLLSLYALHPHPLIHNMQEKLSYMFTQGGSDFKRN